MTAQQPLQPPYKKGQYLTPGLRLTIYKAKFLPAGSAGMGRQQLYWLKDAAGNRFSWFRSGSEKTDFRVGQVLEIEPTEGTGAHIEAIKRWNEFTFYHLWAGLGTIKAV